ncbi:hypothetical protein D1872_235110 [compost metagenome]
MALGQGRPHRGYPVVNSRLPSADYIPVSLKKNKLPGLPDLRLGLMQIVQGPAFAEQFAFRGIQVLGLTFPQNTPREADHFAVPVMQRKNDAIPKTVDVAASVLLGGDQTALLHRSQIKRTLLQKLNQRIPARRRITDLERVDGFVRKTAILQVLHGGLPVLGIHQQKMVQLGAPLIGLQLLFQFKISRCRSLASAPELKRDMGFLGHHPDCLREG